MKIGYEAKRVFHNKTGLGNYSRDSIRILASFFSENEYYLYNPKKANTNLFFFKRDNIKERLPSSNFYRKFYNLWRQFGILSDLKRDQIDLFHGLSGELPRGLEKKGIKSIVTIHDLIFVRYPELYPFFDRKIHFYKFKKAAQQADIIIAISEQTKQDIINFLNIPASKIKVIYQGCQNVFKKNYTDEVQDKVIKKFNLPKQFVLNVGTLETRKNALNIVKAIKDINTHLVLVGRETPYTQQIHEYIKNHQIQNKVSFLKNVSNEELAILYQKASVFVYPSIFEGFGIPIIEALFSKTPVITTNSGVFPEAGGPDSLYINPNSVQEIKEKIEWILNNPNEAEVISKKGFEYAQQFTDEVIAKNLMNCYRSLF
ncbi:glycosyltransferase family 1 protein [Flavobacterium oreochromis]|uniref:Glycosyltransferase family 1 protein n=1 Tax=Flavobacterium oreochromis TaxID=2906078 RepID=A0ABW8P6W3_9FLAO|nr:glycosyltransferase family 1 protein [Flavobacterium oreochromis]OWP76627.1 glycosyl transferase family 1 [Flavobacterium oreochromis]